MAGQLTAAIYVRISKDREETGLGVEAQLEDCRKFADARHWQVREKWVLVENDTSATTGRRPRFERLMDGMQGGAFDVVIVCRLDRLMRSMRDMARLYEMFDRTGTILATADFQIDLSTEHGRASMIMWGAFAQIEIETMRGRVRRKAQQNLAAGRPANGGSRAFGWELDRKTPRPGEVAMIRDVATRVLDGASLTSMCRYLDQQGFLTPGKLERGDDGKPTGRVTAQSKWTTPRLAAMLGLPRHAGILTYRGQEVLGPDGQPVAAQWLQPPPVVGPDGKPVAGEGVPIIDRATHERLKRALAGRSVTPPGWSNVRQHLLTGLLECGICGQRLFASHSGERNGRSPVWTFRCRQHVSRARDLLEGYVLAEVVRRAASPEHRARIVEWETVDQEAMRSQIDAKRATLAELEADFIDNGGNAARFARTTAALEEQIGKLEEGRLTELAYATGAKWARIDLSELLSASASLLPADGPGRSDKIERLENQQAAVMMYAERIIVKQAQRGRGFDPASVEIVWRAGELVIPVAVHVDGPPAAVGREGEIVSVVEAVSIEGHR